MNDTFIEETAHVQLDPREVHTLRRVYHALVNGVAEKARGIPDQHDWQVLAVKRIMYFVAATVEAARDGLLQAEAGEQVVEISGIRDIAKLADFFPHHSDYERLARHLLQVRVDQEKPHLK